MTSRSDDDGRTEPTRGRLSPEDYKLSMRISPRSKRPEDNEDLRSLMVHRLALGVKSVLRRSLRHEDRVSIFCEACVQWTRFPRGEPAPIEWQCGGCRRWFRLEIAVYEELEEAEDL